MDHQQWPSPSGTYAYVTNFNSGNLVIINTATNTVVSHIMSGPPGVAFSPSGTYAYMTNAGSNNVLIINQGIGNGVCSCTDYYYVAVGIVYHICIGI